MSQIHSHFVVQVSEIAPEVEPAEIDRQLLSVSEPLRVAPTGREAVLDMFKRVVSAGLLVSRKQRAPLLAALHSSPENDPNQWTSRERRFALRGQILKRLEHSVREGELPEDADVEALSCLCMSFVSGLAASLEDGISGDSLEDSIALFVESVGFHKVRMPKRRSPSGSQTSKPVLTLVKR
jgi:hypothetical protein